MEIKTKYNTGEQIGFVVNEKEIIARINDIEAIVKRDGTIIIKYYVDINTIIDNGFGEMTEAPMIVEENNVKGKVKVIYQ